MWPWFSVIIDDSFVGLNCIWPGLQNPSLTRQSSKEICGREILGVMVAKATPVRAHFCLVSIANWRGVDEATLPLCLLHVVFRNWKGSGIPDSKRSFFCLKLYTLLIPETTSTTLSCLGSKIIEFAKGATHHDTGRAILFAASTRLHPRRESVHSRRH